MLVERLRRRRLVAVWVLVAACLVPGVAVADTVILVGADAEARAALTTAGQADGWQVEVRKASPGSHTVEESTRALAEREHGDAVLWLVSGPHTTTLYVYDRGADRTLVRTLPYGPPFGEAQAAELAHTSRGMLRSLRGQPDIADQPAAPETPAAPAEPLLGVEVALGLRNTGPELRLGVSYRWRWLQLALVLDAAPADSVDDKFKGEVNDNGLAVEARHRIPLAEKVAIRPGVGLAFHDLAVSGRVNGGGGGTLVDDSQVVPALRAEVQVDWQLASRVALGAEVSVDVGLSSPSFASGTTVVYTPDRARFFVGAAITLGLL